MNFKGNSRLIFWIYLYHWHLKGVLNKEDLEE